MSHACFYASLAFSTAAVLAGRSFGRMLLSRDRPMTSLYPDYYHHAYVYLYPFTPSPSLCTSPSIITVSSNAFVTSSDIMKLGLNTPAS